VNNPVFSAMRVELIDHMGMDDLVVDGARASFNKTADNFNEVQNGNLTDFLARHKHTTPFRHPTVCLRIKAPIFIARQLVKHQVGFSWSEMSRRYVEDNIEFWLPGGFRKKAANVKQGSSDEVVENNDKLLALAKMKAAFDLEVYEQMLSAGVCTEQARIFLPLNLQTEWVWTGSLFGWYNLCKQRLDPHAQAEVRIVAEQIDAIMAELYPVSWNALRETDSLNLTRSAHTALKNVIADLALPEVFASALRSELARAGVKGGQVKEVLEALGVAE